MNKQPYKLYTDKIQDFECQLYLKGIPLEQAKARMIVESKDTSLTFSGTINKKGKCSIPIGSLGNKLGNTTGGLMRLEILAGNVFFQPWKSSFIIKGREFNEPININEVNESIQNSLKIELELNNMKQDIREISKKVVKYYDNEETINSNETIENKIQLCEEKLGIINDKLVRVDDELKTVHGKSNAYETRIKNINNMKQDIKNIISKLDTLVLMPDDERYNLSLEKWSITNKDSLNEEIKIDSDFLDKEKVNKKDDYVDIVDNWSSSNIKNKNNSKTLNEEKVNIKKEKNDYVEIVDKWRTINEKDF